MIELISELGNLIAQNGVDVSSGWHPDAAQHLASAAAALAVGLAALGSGIAENGIGAAAVGAMAEDEDLFVRGLILTVIPETLVILALVVVFLV